MKIGINWMVFDCIELHYVPYSPVSSSSSPRMAGKGFKTSKNMYMDPPTRNYAPSADPGFLRGRSANYKPKIA